MNKVMAVVAATLIVVGIGSAAGGVAGAVETRSQAISENVVTGDDASIPEAAVVGPLTMKSQADNILKHTLGITDGARYSEMDREDPTRDIWVTSTTLRTALHLGVMAYALSAFAVVLGIALVAAGAGFAVIGLKLE